MGRGCTAGRLSPNACGGKSALAVESELSQVGGLAMRSAATVANAGCGRPSDWRRAGFQQTATWCWCYAGKCSAIPRRTCGTGFAKPAIGSEGLARRAVATVRMAPKERHPGESAPAVWFAANQPGAGAGGGVPGSRLPVGPLAAEVCAFRPRMWLPLPADVLLLCRSSAPAIRSVARVFFDRAPDSALPPLAPRGV